MLIFQAHSVDILFVLFNKTTSLLYDLILQSIVHPVYSHNNQILREQGGRWLPPYPLNNSNPLHLRLALRILIIDFVQNYLFLWGILFECNTMK